MVSGIPFSQRTTAAVAVFACIFIASPQGAQGLRGVTVAQISALALEYGQLINLYPSLITQDVANQQSVLNAEIASAITIIGNLSTTLAGMTASTPDSQVILAGWQSIVANMLVQVKAAGAAPGDAE